MFCFESSAADRTKSLQWVVVNVSRTSSGDRNRYRAACAEVEEKLVWCVCTVVVPKEQ